MSAIAVMGVQREQERAGSFHPFYISVTGR